MSLRDIEKCYSHISLYYASKAAVTFNMVPLIPLILVLKIKYHKIYELLKSGAELSEFDKSSFYIELINKKKILEKHRIEKILHILSFCTLSDEKYQAIDQNDTEITRYGQFLWHYDLDRQSIIPIICKRLDMFSLSQ